MSAILNSIKDTIMNGVSVSASGTSQYGRFPIVVKDTTNSITAGWELLYRIEQSKFNGKPRDPYGHFSELRIPNFNNFYTLIQQVYSQFKQGVNVEQKYDTNFAVYQPNDQLWFTCLDRKAGTSITITVTDDKSPFHMLYLNFFITMSMDNNQPYMIGYDSCYNQESGVFTEKLNAFMLPRKKRYVPVIKHDNGASTIKAQGVITPQGLVQIDESQTETVYIQEISNERKLLAGIYEKAIIELVLDQANELLPASQNNNPFNNNQQMQAGNQPNQAFGQTMQANQPAIPNSFMATQQPQGQPQSAPAQGANVFAAWMNANTSEVF